MLFPMARDLCAPATAKKLSPSESKKTMGCLRRSRRGCAKIVATETTATHARYRQSAIPTGGSEPRQRCRMIPPPQAVA